MLALFGIMKRLKSLRVSAKEEIAGLDLNGTGATPTTASSTSRTVKGGRR
jgi:ammonia channel protein AmtB